METNLPALIGNILGFLLIVAGIVVLWILPVVLGLRWAGEKRYSKKWMWFGIHPVGAWIVAAVMQAIPPRTLCVKCREPFNAKFSRCPYCEHPNAATTRPSADDDSEQLPDDPP